MSRQPDPVSPAVSGDGPGHQITTGQPEVDVLVPTYRRPAALAATLVGLLGQTHRPARVVVSDQGPEPVAADPVVAAACGVLGHAGVPVTIERHLPRRGLAEQRHHLLTRARAALALFLDDDVICEPHVLGRLVRALVREGCGFVGAFVNAPSAVASAKPVDALPPGLTLDLWDGPVRPERVRPGEPAWERRHVHFAAYQHHLARRLGCTPDHDRLYRVAWVGGCVLFDTAKLRRAGGFSFWPSLPPDHCGEDVLAQLRVMERFGGAGLLPSGAWHQEVPTTTPQREADAPHLIPV